MRSTDIIRNVLDLLDALEGDNPVVSQDDDSVNFDLDQDGQPDMKIDIHQNAEPDDRFKSILAMLDTDSFGQYSNTPNEIVAPVSAVTTDAGGGLNGPKHPDDIRVKDPRGYE